MGNINIDSIKVSSKLDDVIKDAIEEGYKVDYKVNRKYKVVKIAIIVILATLVFNTEFVDASIDKFMYTIENFIGNEEVDSIPDDFTSIIGKTIDDKNIKVTLNEFIINEDNIMFTTKLRDRFVIDKAQGILPKIYIDGELLQVQTFSSSYHHNNDGSMDILSVMYIDGIDINREMNIVVDYNKIEVKTLFNLGRWVSGDWKYEFMFDGREQSARTITKNINENVSIDGGDVLIETVRISPNTIKLDTKSTSHINASNFIIRDDKGKEYLSNSSIGNSFDNTIDVYYILDATDINFIDIIPEKDGKLFDNKSLKVDIRY